jgi:hypothetical protein
MPSRRLPASYAALLAATLAAAACAKKPVETRRLDFDEATTGKRLGKGWSGWEKTPPPESATFAWAEQQEVTVSVRSAGDGPRLVRFRAWPFVYPDSPPQTATVWVNDAKIETVTLASAAKTYQLSTPKEVWRAGENVLKLSFAYAEAPKDRTPPSEDTRTLAAAFDWIEIVPLETPK